MSRYITLASLLAALLCPVTNVAAGNTDNISSRQICCRIEEGYFCSSCGGLGCGQSAYQKHTKIDCDRFSNAPAESRYCMSSYCDR